MIKLILKPDLLEKCESYLDFRRIDLDDKESITKPKDMNIGFAARSSIQEWRKNDEIRNSDVAVFSVRINKVYCPILKKLFGKLAPYPFGKAKNLINSTVR